MRTLLSVMVVACAAAGAAERVPAAGQGPLRVWAVDAMKRVGPTDAVGGADTVHVWAARGEWESFQVVVSARGSGLTHVEASLGALLGPDRALVGTAWLYREEYVPVTSSTPFSPLPPGPYADALIPFTHPDTGVPLAGARFDAVPFDLANGGNQPLWVEVLVPPDAAAGDYSGSLTVTADGGLSASIPVTLTVWAFLLPQEPGLRSSFWMADYQMSDFYDLSWSTDAAELYRITRRYYDVLLDHRLMPTRPVDSNPGFDGGSGQPVYGVPYPGLGTAAENLSHYLEQGRMAACNTPFWSWYPFADPLGTDRQAAQAYVGAVLQHFAGIGSRTVPYAYLFDLDEPNSAAAYQAVRDWGLFFDQVEIATGLPIPMLVTEHPTPDEPSWGSLVGAVDVWVPCCDTVWLSEDYYGHGVIADRLAAGDEVWWYTALAQMSSEWWAAHGYPPAISGDNAPIWQLDYPPLNYRIAPWFAAHYGFSGLLYWQVAAWNQDPWTDPGFHHSSGYTYNGEGQLVYPGREDEVGFDGPVASMRMKWLREGMEDFEYIQMLRRLGHETFAMDQVHAVARNMGDWEEDPALWLAARHALGAALDALEPVFFDGFETADHSQWSVVVGGDRARSSP